MARRLTGLRHGPGLLRHRRRSDRRTHSHATHMPLGSSPPRRATMISTPVRVWPEHGSAAPPVHTTGRACIYHDHSSTGQGRRALLRHCHASRISPPGYAHGQDGTTTHRHTPWAGARALLLPTRKCQVQPLSQTLMSSTQDPDPLHFNTEVKPGTGTFSTGGPTTSRRTYSNPGESHQLRNGKQVNLTRITDFGTGTSLNTPDTFTQTCIAHHSPTDRATGRP
jgi:hypothetical protein